MFERFCLGLTTVQVTSYLILALVLWFDPSQAWPGIYKKMDTKLPSKGRTGPGLEASDYFLISDRRGSSLVQFRKMASHRGHNYELEGIEYIQYSFLYL